MFKVILKLIIKDLRDAQVFVGIAISIRLFYD